MGDDFGDGDARERPVHTVELDAFYIGTFEITNGEWQKFRDDPGYDDPTILAGGRAWCRRIRCPYWTQANNHGGGTPDSDDYPVLGVNWDAAVAYCHWLSAKTGQDVSLAHRGRVGEGGARNRSAPLSVGQRHRSLARELRRRAGV